MSVERIYANPYPLRQTSELNQTHSLAYSTASQRKVKKQFHRFYADFNKAEETSEKASFSNAHHPTAKTDLSQTAEAFARFATALNSLSGKRVTGLHVESAYALLHRRIEGIARREDRHIVAGLVCSALASQNVRAHLITENELALENLKQWLLPVFEKLNQSVACVEAGMEESDRRHAYRQSITLVSVRECAMDFLRDVIKWPQRSNKVLAKVDQMTGRRSHLRDMLLSGLPCAVLIDADAALIDNARTPIALTADAHPMHETDALKQALSMAEKLEQGAHYVLTEQDAEVLLTPNGAQQLEAWAEQLDGGWKVPNIARLMLSVAIAVNQVLTLGTHYQVKKNAIQWLVDDTLIPGLAFYEKPFLTRMLELKETLEVSHQREVVIRASYQQIFNRYQHLCGCCHSTKLIEKELDKIYGLTSASRWPVRARARYHDIQLFDDDAQRATWLEKTLSETDSSANIILVNKTELSSSLAQALSSAMPSLLNESTDLTNLLQSGATVIAQSVVAEHRAEELGAVQGEAVNIYVCGRSEQFSEDLRAQFWVQDSVLKDSQRTLLLSQEDEMFSDISLRRYANLKKGLGKQFAQWLIERKIIAIQRSHAKESYKIRQSLLNHDSVMQGMLSFSGRGPYD
ncbi:MAG: hypothetical protein V3V09_08445 [Arenicellales bacterium]